MLGDSSVLGSSGGGGDNTTAIRAQEGGDGDGGGGGGVGSNSGEEERSSVRGGGGGEEGGDRSFGGNRWPRQETLALLKIRSDMDVAFRDASVKGPLWEEVSRKLAELGYHRSAKKCKEKFENVYKYHRRTKEGRTGKSDGRTYRFFDQLEALENQPPTPTPMLTSTSTQQPKAHHQSTVAVAAAATTMATMAMMAMSNPPPTLLPHSNISISTTSTVSSAAAAPHPIISVPSQGIAAPTIPNSFPPTNPTIIPPPPQPPPTKTTANLANMNPTYHHQHHHAAFPSSIPSISADLVSNYSTSSSTSSDEELEGRAKRKRKWKDFFQRLMKEVIQKQEELQQRFLEAIEKREQERMVREETWRMQEMTRINREREILAQERSITAAKDTAVMSFLQKISENPGSCGQLAQNTNLQLPLKPPPPLPQPQSAPPPPLQPTLSSAPPPPPPENNGENLNFMPAASSSRWPKVEVQALIKLRTSLDSKYQENGPKGPLWEEISAAMRELGYNRNAKRCKEKWENINKYFKKVKESNKRRPEDSKTCPYFHQLDNLYRDRNKFENNNNTNSPNQITMKAENAVPLMVRPEQQWPPQQENNDREDHMESENIRHDQNQSEDPEDKDMGDEDEEDEEEEEESGDIGNYEIVPNKGAAPPVGAAAAE